VSIKLDFGPLDAAVQEFSEAAEAFEKLWMEDDRRPACVKPKPKVSDKVVRQAIVRLLKAARHLLDAVEAMPPNVRQALVHPPPARVGVCCPPLPLPQQAREVIAFAEQWLPKFTDPRFWVNADFEYDFYFYVGQLLLTVWYELTKTLECYQRLKEQIEVDVLLDQADKWLGNVALQDAERAAPVADETTNHDTRPAEVKESVPHGTRQGGVGRSKRSTEKGEARLKITAALFHHHQYDGDSVLNDDPIGVNELHRLAGVSKGMVSTFFKKEFCPQNQSDGHARYRALCRDRRRLIAWLKTLDPNEKIRGHQLLNSDIPSRPED